MERSPTPKILRLAPNSVFVSFLCPFFIHCLSYISLLLPFFSLTTLRAHLCLVCTQLTRYPRSLYPGASLIEAYSYGLHARHMCYTSACTFYSPLYASI